MPEAPEKKSKGLGIFRNCLLILFLLLDFKFQVLGSNSCTSNMGSNDLFFFSCFPITFSGVVFFFGLLPLVFGKKTKLEDRSPSFFLALALMLILGIVGYHKFKSIGQTERLASSTVASPSSVSAHSELVTEIPEISGNWNTVVHGAYTDVLHVIQSEHALTGTMVPINGKKSLDSIEGRIETDGIFRFVRIHEDRSLSSETYQGVLSKDASGQMLLKGYSQNKEPWSALKQGSLTPAGGGPPGATENKIPHVVRPQRFEALSAVDQAFVRNQHDLAFNYYRNKEYDKAIFEIHKLFGVVQDYKDARDIEHYAREGKSKLEAYEREHGTTH